MRSLCNGSRPITRRHAICGNSLSACHGWHRTGRVGNSSGGDGGRAATETPAAKGAVWFFVGSSECDLTDLEQTRAHFRRVRPTHVVNLAAMVGELSHNLCHNLQFFVNNLDNEEQLQELSNKRITRRAAAAAAAALSTRDRNAMATQFGGGHDAPGATDSVYFEFAGWFLKLAVVQECLSRFRSADALAVLRELDPFLAQLPLSLELRARIFFENGEYKRSCEVFEEIRRLYPRHLNGMEIHSTALWQLHDSKKLSALASKMAEIARNQPQTWCIAANCFSVEKQHETAIECQERSIRLDHRFAYAYSQLGHELIDMNDFGRAAQAFRKAVQFSPNDYRAWYGLGLVNFKEEQLQMARMNLLRAVGINPNNNVLLCQLAVIEQALHNTDAAMQCLESALKHSPNNVPCRFHKARLLFDIGKYEAARAELEELRVLSPDEAHVFFLLGRVNRKLGNTMALLNFSWATEIDPRGEQNNSALTQDKGPYDDEPI
ncbi:hypothetical protein niasHT_022832 [Heterodera trifolii]|uniref:Cell division cycle protein 27 homolog n=1 Tax=Heterodera trifolii TaxID=157864 RepID=A0ABD2JKK9_9BILA